MSGKHDCPIHGASYRSMGESAEAKAERLRREAEARLEVKRRHAVFEAVREKARQDRSLELDDFRFITTEFFHRLPYDTAKQFVILNGFITPAMAKKRKVEATGDDNGNDYGSYFEKLVSNADLIQLRAWLVELALIQHRDRAPYSYYGDSPKADPLFETTARWRIDVEAEKAVVTQPVKQSRSQGESKSRRSPNVSANQSTAGQGGSAVLPLSATGLPRPLDESAQPEQRQFEVQCAPSCARCDTLGFRLLRVIA